MDGKSILITQQSLFHHNKFYVHAIGMLNSSTNTIKNLNLSFWQLRITKNFFSDDLDNYNYKTVKIASSISDPNIRKLVYLAYFHSFFRERESSSNAENVF